jgi:hypothetical protein
MAMYQHGTQPVQVSARFCLFAVLSLTTVMDGCGSPDAGDGLCAQRSGTYKAQLTERSGTCGAIPEQIVTIDAQPVAPDPPCTGGEIRYSPNNCEVTNVNITCPENGVAPGASSILNGKFTWSHDGSSGSGILTLVVKDSTGAVLCQSSYNAVDVRL